ncbi:MocR-like pyridoxine biosynthesis transcription factor PdxR [Fusibacter ferrireducens]|uniref:PLP-dependent aminotransferase family protein n=1 Tax=Fusibacter ferrireducens TaxID=2785058 RepID=A0ABR9ZU18_9FIRM|nr:PLP-dependent aminotransferase family protein [Fusibacter ferrireducens]MBF4693375.1 PLP-dependent aminotransferase family protein [Fusibacter ferrireducens]
MEIYIELQRNSRVPLYIQIYEAFRKAILSGEMEPYSKLMSVMQLKRLLCVSRNTVEIAYLQLLSEGFIFSKKGSGYFVCALDNMMSFDDLSDIACEDKAEVPPIKSLHLIRNDVAYDFKPGSVDQSQFPFKKWHEIARNIMNSDNPEILMYSDPRGERALRMEIAKYLKHSRGVLCDPDQIIIGAGTQTLISLLCLLLKEGPDLTVAVENPGFTAVRKAFEWHGCEIIPVSLNNNALDISAVKGVEANLSAIYLTPSNQHPMGGLLNVSERLSLLNWAKDKATYIIEDDYDSEFRYDIHPVPTLFGLDQYDQVIYMGTFSKTLFPGMHVGYTVLPLNLATRFSEIGQYYNQTASKIHQLTIAEFMKQGLFEKHIRKMRTVYGKKHQKMVTTIQETFGDRVCVIGDHAGVNLALRVKLPYSEKALIKRAEHVGIAVYPISFYYSASIQPVEYNDVFLGYGHMTLDEIGEAIALLGEVWTAVF